jgi:hypothetical protein
MYGGGLLSKGIPFVPTFSKICQLLLKYAKGMGGMNTHKRGQHEDERYFFILERRQTDLFFILESRHNVLHRTTPTPNK